MTLSILIIAIMAIAAISILIGQLFFYRWLERRSANRAADHMYSGLMSMHEAYALPGDEN